jgi:hypothetical protein
MKKFVLSNSCRRGASLLLLFTSIGLAAGCGGKSGDGTVKNEVTGKVTLNDKPVAGQVVFAYPDGKELVGLITADGAYTIPEPPAGNVKVCVRPMVGGPGAGLKGGPELSKDGPTTGGGGAPPPKYQSVATSGLTFEVKTGKQTYDIPLK